MTREWVRDDLWTPDSCCKREDGAATIRLDDPAKWEPVSSGLVLPTEVVYPQRWAILDDLSATRRAAGAVYQERLNALWRRYNTVVRTTPGWVYEAPIEETPEGDVEQEPIDLGTCWRCMSAKVDRSDVVGLCASCKQLLAEL